MFLFITGRLRNLKSLLSLIIKINTLVRFEHAIFVKVAENDEKWFGSLIMYYDTIYMCVNLELGRTIRYSVL